MIKLEILLKILNILVINSCICFFDYNYIDNVI